jgi:hypothetical protein
MRVNTGSAMQSQQAEDLSGINIRTNAALPLFSLDSILQCANSAGGPETALFRPCGLDIRMDEDAIASLVRT